MKATTTCEVFPLAEHPRRRLAIALDLAESTVLAAVRPGRPAEARRRYIDAGRELLAIVWNLAPFMTDAEHFGALALEARLDAVEPLLEQPAGELAQVVSLDAHRARRRGC